MDVQDKDKAEANEDYRWLIKEATWGEFWFTMDTVVDWIKKREQIEKLNGENKTRDS